MNSNKKIAIFPGSFDPFTLGHHDIVLRSTEIFDKIIVGIGSNSSKTRFFPLDVLVPKIKSVYINHPNVEVEVFTGLTAEFAKQKGARYIVRGLRNTTDFEYENSIAQANKYLWQDLETVFLITSPERSAISSTIIRDIYKFGKNVDNLLPYKMN